MTSVAFVNPRLISAISPERHAGKRASHAGGALGRAAGELARALNRYNAGYAW